MLRSQFSTGVTLTELDSIAKVISGFAGIPRPTRLQRRNFCEMIVWYRTWWQSVTPWLTLVQLRDKHNVIIDARREAFEMKSQYA
jgi:hypothetical protein